LALCAIALFTFKDSIVGPKHISTGEFATRTGEHMNLLLADGSQITLGAHSRLSVDFTPSMRKLSLDAGEAFFNVQKDPRRPFTVSALDSTITALGTAFNVRAVEDRVTVTVTEGVVREDKSAVRIARGQEVTYAPDKALQAVAVHRVDPEESARWRDGWLVYRHEPLRYVIADIARYSELHLQVDPAVADVQFTGAVFKDRIPEWLNALPEVSPVKIEADGATFKVVKR
jgi:transmembrane sensor